jgi:hypothetical protein
MQRKLSLTGRARIEDAMWADFHTPDVADRKEGPRICVRLVGGWRALQDRDHLCNNLPLVCLGNFVCTHVSW